MQVHQLAGSLGKVAGECGKRNSAKASARHEERVDHTVLIGAHTEPDGTEKGVTDDIHMHKQLQQLREQYEILVCELKLEIKDLEDELGRVYSVSAGF